MIRLKLLTPLTTVVDEPVRKLIAPGERGQFCLLPRHADYVAVLAPGILTMVREDGIEEFLAVDEGVLVKRGDDVLVSTRRATRGAPLGQLHDTVARQYQTLDDRERAARTATARLEADFVRRFLAWGEERHG